MTFIHDGRTALSNPAAGGKARGLAAAERAGLRVPPWFVIGGESLHDPGLRSRFSNALRVLSPSDELVAVRSSAIDEDGIRHSFAGQFESFLNVAPADAWEKVEAVWRSGSGDRVVRYRRERGLAAVPSLPSVIVQRMVHARAAGVAFSADPVSARRGIAVVSAVRGLGSALVSGEADADTWHVDRHGTIVERCLAVEERSHAAAESAAASLTDAEILAVAGLARCAERCFGRPQDIEWAYEDDRLWLLQSRPIGTLEQRADPDGAPVIWDNSNIVESYSGITTPLTFSFASEIYEHVYRQFCRLLHVPGAAIASHDEAFRNMLGLVRGRLYYNLPNWYRVLALLPGFTLNRVFMEQMMGVSETLPEALRKRIACSTAHGRFRDAARVARTTSGLVAAHFIIERRIRAFYARLDAALAPPDPPLAEMRPDELAAYYRTLRSRLLLSWDAPLVNDFFAMIFYGLLRSASRAWCGDSDGTLQNDLVGGEGGLVSAEPAARIQQLARTASANAAFVERLVSGTIDEIRDAMESMPPFRSAFDAYVAKFGDRTVGELKLESATLHDDPLPLLRSVGALARQFQSRGGHDRGGPTDEGGGTRLRARARQRAHEALARRPIRRAVFGWILRNARARVRDRENLRLERTRLFGRVRRIFVQMGRRLHALSLLDDPSDVFYLEVDEILAFVEGRASTTNLRGLVALRREEFRGYQQQPAPDSRFETRGIVYHGHDYRRPAVTELEDGDERRGIGCSPGRISGPVRVVRDPRSIGSGYPSILVAEHTDPGWVMAFPSSLGILVERGSLLSHAAIVARELGIPAVVSVPGLTRWLHDGDWIEFDGATGVIRKVRTVHQPEAASAK